MKCPRCEEKYTCEPPYIPRILIACGHTVCEFCILQLADRKEARQRYGSNKRSQNEARIAFECPECKAHNEGPNL